MSSRAASEPVVLITGSNKGIGLEAVRQLSDQRPSATILLGTRSLANGDAAIASLRQLPEKAAAYTNIRPLAIDVTDAASIARAVEEVKATFGRLDVLVNNSGLLAFGEHDSRLQEVFAVNLYGLRAVTLAFLPLLPPAGLIINVSSETGSWATHACAADIQQRLLDPTTLTWEAVDELAAQYMKGDRSSQWPAPSLSCYTVSKALVSAWSRCFALQHPEVQVAVVTPGWCQTDGSKGTGPRTAAQGGASIIWPITHPFTSGHFYQDGQEVGWCHPPPANRFKKE